MAVPDGVDVAPVVLVLVRIVIHCGGRKTQIRCCIYYSAQSPLQNNLNGWWDEIWRSNDSSGCARSSCHWKYAASQSGWVLFEVGLNRSSDREGSFDLLPDYSTGVTSDGRLRCNRSAANRAALAPHGDVSGRVRERYLMGIWAGGYGGCRGAWPGFGLVRLSCEKRS